MKEIVSKILELLAEALSVVVHCWILYRDDLGSAFLAANIGSAFIGLFQSLISFRVFTSLISEEEILKQGIILAC
jgi:hypothetical protein